MGLIKTWHSQNHSCVIVICNHGQFNNVMVLTGGGFMVNTRHLGKISSFIDSYTKMIFHYTSRLLSTNRLISVGKIPNSKSPLGTSGKSSSP